MYVIDDMLPQPNWPEGHAEEVADLIATLEQLKGFHVSKLSWAKWCCPRHQALTWRSRGTRQKRRSPQLYVRARVSHYSVLENLASRTRRAGETNATASITATLRLARCARSCELRASSLSQPFAGFVVRSSRTLASSVSVPAASPRRANSGAAFRAVPVRALVLARFVWRSRPNRALKRDAPNIVL
jgi:hypothetical protein